MDVIYTSPQSHPGESALPLIVIRIKNRCDNYVLWRHRSAYLSFGGMCGGEVFLLDSCRNFVFWQSGWKILLNWKYLISWKSVVELKAWSVWTIWNFSALSGTIAKCFIELKLFLNQLCPQVRKRWRILKWNSSFKQNISSKQTIGERASSSSPRPETTSRWKSGGWVAMQMKKHRRNINDSKMINFEVFPSSPRHSCHFHFHRGCK